MAENDKLKLLYLMQILLEQTDEKHILNAIELCEKLESEYGLTCNRKTIYRDVERLRTFGIEIEQIKGDKQGYYVAARDFELPELKLLVDAVQSSKFITKKKSDELIKKLGKLASREEAKQLERYVFIYNRPKTENETIYYNVDAIHNAIYQNKQISFQYAEWTVKKTQTLRHEGARYALSPWSLTWDDENYYLVAYDDSSKKIKHFRVDKMRDTQVEPVYRQGREQFENFDLAAYAKKTFGMYAGHDESVTLVCKNSLAGVVLDRFGNDIMMHEIDEEHFMASVLVSVSRQFFGWVTGIGKDMHIQSPESVRKEYQAYLKEIMGSYEE